MSEITVALLQMTDHGYDQDANLAKGEAYCRRAQQMGADIAVFPEMWNIGYTFESPPGERVGDLWRAPACWPAAPASDSSAVLEAIRQWQDHAIEQNSAFVTHFRSLARELDMAIAVTYLERWNGAPRNTVSLIDRHGAVVLTYAKVHTCAFDLPEAALTPGDDFPVCTLDTTHGSVAVGAMICFDCEFPESARVLMLKGAEIILTPNACELETNRLGQFRARAYENMVGVARANYAGPGFGHSVAYDPIAFTAAGRSRDTLLVEAGEQEDVFLARFDLDAIRNWRTREALGNAFRRPCCYSALTAPEVYAPFVRVNATGERYDEVGSSHSVPGMESAIGQG